MNTLETAWSEHLAAELAAGNICAYWYEPISLRLAKLCNYKPDFMVIDAEGFVEIHETKGFMQEAANVRIKVAAEKFPQFVFKLIKARRKKDGGGYTVETIGPKL
ncbi:MAG: DUF1064 domain-containing protein [Myxococcales bacterium]|nr:DUF1064 domain-containing protein [Myxococcales bacterium]